jgi:hypothetical protein
MQEQVKGEEYKFPDEVEPEIEAKVEVEIEDDTPEPDRGRKTAPPPEDPTDEELASYDDKVQARIKKFTRGYHDERRAKEEALRERDAAENYARQVLEENKKLHKQLATGSQAYIENSKVAAEAAFKAAKQKYKEAYESGDADAVADAQAEITKATLAMDKTENMRPIEVDDREFTPAKPEPSKLSPRTQKWLDSNSDWWGQDEEMTMAAMGIDKKLQREYGPDYVGTEEYFRTIDKTMRKRFPEHFDAQSHEDDDPPPKQRAEPADEDEPPRRASKISTVVAPASRSTPPNRIRLKASEAAIAKRLGVPLDLYAKQVAQLKRGE